MNSSKPHASAAVPVATVAVLAMALVATAFLIWYFADEEMAYFLRTEAGGIEMATLAIYGLAILLAAGLSLVKRGRLNVGVPVILFVAMMRELDMDSRTGAEGRLEKISSIRYWRSADFALFEKLVIGLVIVVGVYATVSLLLRGAPQLLRDLRRWRPYAVSVIGIAVFAAVAFVLDNRLPMEEPLSRPVLFFSLCEECLELGIPLLVCLALIQWRGDAARAATPVCDDPY